MLIHACKYGNLNLVRHLIKSYDANPKAKNETSIIEASKSGNLYLVKYLVEEKCADPHAYCDKPTFNAYCFENRNPEILRYFLEVHGVDIREAIKMANPLLSQNTSTRRIEDFIEDSF